MEIINLIRDLETSKVKLAEGAQLFRVDNQAALRAVNNIFMTPRLKHISVRHFFLKDLIDKGIVKSDYVKSEENPADGFTKVLDKIKFKNWIGLLGLQYKDWRDFSMVSK